MWLSRGDANVATGVHEPRRLRRRAATYVVRRVGPVVDGRRRDHARHPVHRVGDSAGLPLPGPPLRRGLRQQLAAADGPARPAEGLVRRRGPAAPGARDRAGDAALRDDPRGQRVCVVLPGRQRPPLGRRSAQRAQGDPGLRLRGRQPDRVRKRPVVERTRRPGRTGAAFQPQAARRAV